MKMRDRQIPVLVGDNDDRTTCPTCGMSIRMERITYRKHHIERYRPNITGEDVAQVLRPEDPEIAAELRARRKGKKTVAIVGMASTSCSLAPFDDPEVEIWGLNESHAFHQWFTRWDRWFQIHSSKSWQRYIAKRNVRGHYGWLKSFQYGDFESKEQPREHAWQDKADFYKEADGERYVLIEEQWRRLKPIYLQYYNPEIPNSISYPLREVSDNIFANFRRGDAKVKYFTSTFAYMMGIALLPSEGFQRIEVYGFEMADDLEYIRQKACAEFWIGAALARGLEVYTPAGNQLLYSSLYGGDEQGAGW